MSHNEVQRLKNELEEKLREYGSFELMANLAVKERYAQHPAFYDPANPMAENSFVAFSLGMFLSNNNIESGEPHPLQLSEFVDLLTRYFYAFKTSLMHVDKQDHQPEDSITFLSQSQKTLDDTNPHIFPDQSEEYMQEVFCPLDDYFISKCGFSAEDASKFADIFASRLGKHMKNRYKIACEKYREGKEQLAKHEAQSLLEWYAKNNFTAEQVLSFQADVLRISGSNSVLTINVDDYCKEQKIGEKDTFRSYLNAFSCTFGDQFEGFGDPLSDNIIFYRPIIKIDDDTFFLPKPNFLHNRLDLLLECILEEEKQAQSNTWDRFAGLKSSYLEGKTFEFFSRIFPEKCLFQNVYYWDGAERREVDLLVVYDNKIFIVESKSGNLPPSAKQEGRAQLRARLSGLIREALRQATGTRDYITSKPTVRFWDRSKDKVRVEVDSTETDYDFFFVNVTLEHLGMFGTNLKNLDAFGFFKKGEYPWSVYVHDLDAVTHLLKEPIYFIHYLEQRLVAQDQDSLLPTMELALLGYYMVHGNFHPDACPSPEGVDVMAVLPDFGKPIDDYYLCGKKRPRLDVPKKLEELLLNLQKYRQKGFTQITSLLLDFPPSYKKLLSKKLTRIFDQISKNRVPNGFTLMAKKPLDIGFSYFPSSDMKNLYKYAVSQYKTRKQEYKIARWAVIGRNVSDKKNHATFFIYDNSPASAPDELSINQIKHQ